eukprot:1119810-Karenia_brevis.AAC.1
MAAVPALRAFLGPIYAWTSAVPTSLCTTLPVMLQLIFAFLSKVFADQTFVRDCKLLAVQKRCVHFRTDAMAESGRVAMGGWLVLEGQDTTQCPWFHLTISETDVPVVFDKGPDQTFPYIAALELMGTLCGLQSFVWTSDRTHEQIIARAATDNQGNSLAVKKGLST